MNRIGLVAVSAVFALGFIGCPSNGGNDGGGNGFDAGNPPPVDGCTGGCAINQVCNTTTRTCEDGCKSQGGCSDGGICQKTASGSFQCLATAVTCNNVTCAPGEVACLNGQCTCLGPSRGVVDTCYVANGQTCGSDGKCRDPKALEECDPARAQCGNAGGLCNPVFGEDLAFCTQDCSNSKPCPRGDRCANFGDNQGCLPDTLFGGFDCEVIIDAGTLPDGGGSTRRITVPVSNRCLLKDSMAAPTETEPTGNCTYAFFRFKDDGPYPFATCRPPGNATEGSICKQDWSDTQRALQCATGLECALTRGNDQGVCLRACNARPPSIDYPTPEPKCLADETCVNLYRREDTNDDSAVLGVCMKKCNSFAYDGGDACPNLGATPTSCLPTDYTGRLLVSNNGDGVCMPQQSAIAQVDQPCAQPDPLGGAACASNQVCAPGTGGAACRQVCDTRCNAGDGGMPAFCSAEHNAKCTGNKTCTRVTSTFNSFLGFCL